MTLATFSPAELRASAEAKAGHDDYGSDSYMTALQPLLHALEHEAKLNANGLAEMRRRIVDGLANRLTLVAWEKEHPDLARAPVKAPMFILGMPRTGSSILHETLAAAPGVRTLVGWETRDLGLAHAARDERYQQRVKAVEDDLARKNEIIPDYAAIHYEDAYTPVECLALTMLDLVSSQFSTVTWAPTYRKFMLGHDMRVSYGWHKRALRYLQANGRGDRWLLKAPMHSLYIGALVETYPDGRFIQTHRDPMAVIGSQCSLYSTLRRGWSDAETTPERVAEDVAYVATMTRGTLGYRRENPGFDASVFDLSFKAFMSDPRTTLVALYEHFGLELSEATLGAMLNYLNNRPREKYGKHRYSLADAGLTVEALAPHFADYTDRCRALI